MRISILKLLSFSFITAIMFACGEDFQTTPETEQEVNQRIPKDMGGLVFNGVVLPNGTISKLSNDGSTLNVQLPEGIIYVAYLNNEFIIADEGGWTCTSTCSGGCDVVKLGKNVGCTRCPSGSTDSCVGSDPTEEGFLSIGQGTGGGFIDLNRGISFVLRSDARMENFQEPNWDVLVQHPEVQNKLQEFISELWPTGEIDTENSRKVLVNVFGTYIRMDIPEGYSNGRLEDLLIDGGEVKCKCNNKDNDECKREVIKEGPIIKVKIGDKCVAGSCEACTMTW